MPKEESHGASDDKTLQVQQFSESWSILVPLLWVLQTIYITKLYCVIAK